MSSNETDNKLPSLFDKCYDYRYADDVKAAGIYPYFRPIEESEGPVVRMDGKTIIMAGSNNYLAQLTNGHLYVTDQNKVYKSTDNGDTWAEVTDSSYTSLTINYNFTGIAAVGNQLYLTTADGTRNSEPIKFIGTTWTEVTTAQSS